MANLFFESSLQNGKGNYCGDQRLICRFLLSREKRQELKRKVYKQRNRKPNEQFDKKEKGTHYVRQI